MYMYYPTVGMVECNVAPAAYDRICITCTLCITYLQSVHVCLSVCVIMYVSTMKCWNKPKIILCLDISDLFSFFTTQRQA